MPGTGQQAGSFMPAAVGSAASLPPPPTCLAQAGGCDGLAVKGAEQHADGGAQLALDDGHRLVGAEGRHPVLQGRGGRDMWVSANR